jgi:hypothetical protein
MNWDAIGAIGEGVGAAAVVFTLAYLAVQIRQSRVAQNAATVEAVHQGFNSINALISADPSLAEIMLKGNADLASLNAVERFRYLQTFQSYVNQYSQMLLLYELGLLSRKLWETHLDALAGSVINRQRGAVNAPIDLWAAVDAYGPPRHSAANYHRDTWEAGGPGA